VSGDVRETRIEAWIAATNSSQTSGRPVVIYCFRGGLRSRTVQGWLTERGVHRPIVTGGYKALRRYLLTSLDTLAESLNFEVVSGPTGSGKTSFLQNSGRPFVDLEALAAHRGSAFGALETPQPTQIDFENALAVTLIRLKDCVTPILIENESRLIGHRAIPEALFKKMRSSPKLWLDVSLEDRVENIYRDYVLASRLGTRQDSRQFEDFRRAVQAISRKLGGLRAEEILIDIENSRREFESGRGLDTNRVWIEKLLRWYYDVRYGSTSNT
jgi:tRNA 2-selenouridine synthase